MTQTRTPRLLRSLDDFVIAAVGCDIVLRVVTKESYFNKENIITSLEAGALYAGMITIYRTGIDYIKAKSFRGKL